MRHSPHRTERGWFETRLVTRDSPKKKRKLGLISFVSTSAELRERFLNCRSADSFYSAMPLQTRTMQRAIQSPGSELNRFRRDFECFSIVGWKNTGRFFSNFQPNRSPIRFLEPTSLPCKTRGFLALATSRRSQGDSESHIPDDSWPVNKIRSVLLFKLKSSTHAGHQFCPFNISHSSNSYSTIVKLCRFVR